MDRARSLNWLIAAAVAVYVGMVGAGLFVDRAHATSGGVDRWGGHTPSEKSATAEHPAGVYHCHTKNRTPTQQELCDLIAKGKRHEALRAKLDAAERALKRVQDAANATANALQLKLSIKTRELREALAANTILQRKARADVAEAKRWAMVEGERYRNLMDGTRADSEAAAAAKAEAMNVLRQAEARERGAGPSAGRDCRRALNDLVLNGPTTWVGNLKLSDAGRAQLRTVCLE